MYALGLPLAWCGGLWATATFSQIINRIHCNGGFNSNLNDCLHLTLTLLESVRNLSTKLGREVDRFQGNVLELVPIKWRRQSIVWLKALTRWYQILILLFMWQPLPNYQPYLGGGKMYYRKGSLVFVEPKLRVSLNLSLIWLC